METPTITGESIAQFHKIYREFKVLLDESQAELATARLNDDNEITIARNGQGVAVREKDLWDEVWHLGLDSDARSILGEKYPRVFSSAIAAEEKKTEMRGFAIKEWAVDPMAMSLSDIIRVIEGVIDYKLSQHV